MLQAKNHIWKRCRVFLCAFVVVVLRDKPDMVHCLHVQSIAIESLEALQPYVSKSCQTCEYKGSLRWICLGLDDSEFPNPCLATTCGSKHKDHAHEHFLETRHPISFNVRTNRLWCNLCQNEVVPAENVPTFPLGEAILAADQKASVHRPQVSRQKVTPEMVSVAPDESNSNSEYAVYAKTGVFKTNATTVPYDKAFSDQLRSVGRLHRSRFNYSGELGGPGADGEGDGIRAGAGIMGLRNIGNTCYMNAALQSLSYCEPLTSAILNGVYRLSPERRRWPTVSVAYETFVQNMWSQSEERLYGRSVLDPYKVLASVREVFPSFRGWAQQDSQEFLRCLMDQMHEELKTPVTQAEHEAMSRFGCSRLSFDDSGHGSSALIRRRVRVEAAQDRASPTSSSDDNDTAYATCDSGMNSEKDSAHSSCSSPEPDRTSPSSSPTPAAYSRRRALAGVRRSAHSESSVDRCQSEQRTRRFRHRRRTNPAPPPNTARRVTRSMASRQESVVNCAPIIDVPAQVHEYRSIISEIFVGRVLSSVQCLTCHNVSETEEVYQDLSLPLPSREQLTKIHSRPSSSSGSPSSLPKSSSSGSISSGLTRVPSTVWTWVSSYFWGPSITLLDCLDGFFSSDELQGDDMYSCEKCSKLRNGRKSCRLLQLPEVLCIHLKRFRHDFAFSTKIGTFVEFPLEDLDLSPYAHKNCRAEVTVYDAFAVICHHGSAGGGHYTSFCLHPVEQRWYECDDSCVTPVDASVVANAEAYVVFYRKKTERMNKVHEEVQQIMHRELRGQRTQDLMRFHISRPWLNRFNTMAEPGPITNYDFLCHHDCIPPLKVECVDNLNVQVTAEVWRYLHERFGGGPACHRMRHCSTCLQRHTRLSVRRHFEYDVFKRMDRICDTTAGLHLISVAWMKRWENFISNEQYEPPGPIDNSMLLMLKNDNYYLRSSNYIKLSNEQWFFFFMIYGGGPEIIHNASIDRRPDRPTVVNTQCSMSLDSQVRLWRRCMMLAEEVQSERRRMALGNVESDDD